MSIVAANLHVSIINKIEQIPFALSRGCPGWIRSPGEPRGCFDRPARSGAQPDACPASHSSPLGVCDFDAGGCSSCQQPRPAGMCSGAFQCICDGCELWYDMMPTPSATRCRALLSPTASLHVFGFRACSCDPCAHAQGTQRPSLPLWKPSAIEWWTTVQMAPGGTFLPDVTGIKSTLLRRLFEAAGSFEVCALKVSSYQSSSSSSAACITTILCWAEQHTCQGFKAFSSAL